LHSQINPDLEAEPVTACAHADTLIPNMTVYEMLMYTAELKNSRSMPLADKRQKVGKASCQLLEPGACAQDQNTALHRLLESVCRSASLRHASLSRVDGHRWLHRQVQIPDAR
jgi:hypothetical protein